MGIQLPKIVLANQPITLLYVNGLRPSDSVIDG